MSDNNRVGIRIFSIVVIVIIALVVFVQLFITSVSEQSAQLGTVENSEIKESGVEVEQQFPVDTFKLPVDPKEINQEATRLD